MENSEKPKIDNSKESAFACCMFDATSGATLINNGLTKREYFSGLAMQGIINSGLPMDKTAEMSVQFADALLTELEKKNDQSKK